MKNFIFRFGGLLASLALVVTTYNINAACAFHAYQAEMPEGAKKLRRF